VTFSGEHQPIRSHKPKWMREVKRKVKVVKDAPLTFRRRRDIKEARKRRQEEG